MPTPDPLNSPRLNPPPKPFEARAKEALVAQLRVRGALDTIRIDAQAGKITVMGRLVPDRTADFNLFVFSLLTAPETGQLPLAVDVSNKFLIHEGALRTVRRVIFSWKPAADAAAASEEFDAMLDAIAGFLFSLPIRHTEVETASLGPAARPERHRTVKPIRGDA